MPNPNQQASTQQNRNIPPDVFRSLRRPNPSTDPDLAFEVSELRKEIAALREQLIPMPSFIATGQSVLDEFKRITGKAD